MGSLGVIAALVAIGAVGGRRGQRTLGRLKWLSGSMAVLSVLVAVLLGLALPHRESGLGVFAAFLWGLIAFVFWCYVAFAKWLTREDDEENEIAR